LGAFSVISATKAFASTIGPSLNTPGISEGCQIQPSRA